MFNALAAGRKVYGQGAYNPTRGPVSAQGAQGYIKREVAKTGNQNLFGGSSVSGRDGQSDTRSGVASKALNRMRNQGRPVTQQRQAPSGSGPKHNNPKPDQSQQPAPQQQAPIINKDGVLELPFNMQVSQDIMKAEQDMNAQLIDLKGQQEQQNLQYGQNMRQTDLDYGNLKRATLNNSAGRGTIFSSGYGQSVLDNSNAYTNQQGDLTSQNSLFNRTVDQQRLGIQSAFQNMMSQFALDQANAAAENAGNIGYGQANKTKGPNAGPGKHKFPNNPKPKHPHKPRRGGKK